LTRERLGQTRGSRYGGRSHPVMAGRDGDLTFRIELWDEKDLHVQELIALTYLGLLCRKLRMASVALNAIGGAAAKARLLSNSR
jgi:hypothetical protein